MTRTETVLQLQIQGLQEANKGYEEKQIRYRDALVRIATGEPDAIEIAIKALFGR